MGLGIFGQKHQLDLLGNGELFFRNLFYDQYFKSYIDCNLARSDCISSWEWFDGV